MHFDISLSHKRTRKRGFTLTEIAIVLGIIGAILGAIWSAASHASNSQKVGTAIGQILAISGGLGALFPSGAISGGDQDLTVLAINSGIVPADMIGSCAGTTWGATYGGPAGCAINPWGSQAIIGSQTGWGGAAVASNKYEIALNPTTNAQCAAFLSALVPGAAADGLVWVYYGGTTLNVTTATSPGVLPIVPA